MLARLGSGVLVAIAFSFVGYLGTFQASTESQEAVNDVVVLPTTNLALNLMSAEVVSRRSGVALISIAAQNEQPRNLLAVRLIALVFSADGYVKGFHAARTGQTIDPVGERLISLTTHGVGVADGDKIAVAPLSVTTAKSTWTADIDALRVSAASWAATGQITTFGGAEIGVQGDCEAGFCTSMHTLCKPACGKGTKEWTCNRTECSFTCTCL